MPAGRTHNARVTALALAIGVNGAFVVLLLASHGAAPAAQQAITAMIWIGPPEPSPVRLPPTRRNVSRSRAPAVDLVRPAAPPPVVAVVPAPPSPQSTAIDLPQLDWHEAASKIAQQHARRDAELAERGNPLKSEPRVLVLPKDRGYEEGHVVRSEDGVLMHYDGDCVTTNNPQAMQPWALDRVEKFFGGSASARAFAKSGGCRADQTSRNRAKALEDAVKPRYLGGKRPLPEDDQSTSAIKIP
jgi:hypothetical protein